MLSEMPYYSQKECRDLAADMCLLFQLLSTLVGALYRNVGGFIFYAL